MIVGLVFLFLIIIVCIICGVLLREQIKNLVHTKGKTTTVIRWVRFLTLKKSLFVCVNDQRFFLIFFQGKVKLRLSTES